MAEQQKPSLEEQIKFMQDELGAAGAAEMDELARDYAAILATLRNHATLQQQLAELQAANVNLPCGHRKADHDDSYGGCVHCISLKAMHEFEAEADQLQQQLAEAKAALEAELADMREQRDTGLTRTNRDERIARMSTALANIAKVKP